MSGHDFFSDAFVRAAGPHGAWVGEQLDAFNTFMPMGEWRVNLDERTYYQSGRAITVSVLGSFSTGDDTWLWGWANPSWGDPAIASAAAAVRAIGERDGIPEFTRQLVDLSGFADPRMAAETLAFAAMGLLGSSGYIGVTANPTGRLYMLTDDEQVPHARPEAITLPRVLMTGAGFLPVPADAVVSGYLAHHDLAFRRTNTEEGASISAELAGGDTLAVGFDAEGRIGAVSVAAAPRTVPSPAWWRAAGPGLAQVLEQDAEFTAFVEASPYRGHDVAAKVLRCGRHDVRVRVLGSLDASGTRWTWDADTHARLTALPGLEHAPEAAAEVDVSDCADPAAAVRLISHGAAGLLDGGCCVDVADDGRTVYLTVDDPVVPRATSAAAVAVAVREAVDVVASLVPETGRPVIVEALTEGYFAARAEVERESAPGGTVLRARIGAEHVTVRVDAKGAATVHTSAGA